MARIRRQAAEWAALIDQWRQIGVKVVHQEQELSSYYAALYGSNLTNEHYIAAANSGARWAGAPRQVGIRLTKVF